MNQAIILRNKFIRLINQPFFKIAENVFFYIYLFLLILPIWKSEFFLTLDLPSHVYNSNLIKQLLKEDSFIKSYLTFNPTYVPNWFSHFYFLVSSYFLDPFNSIKILETLLALSYPLIIRFYLINHSTRYLSFLAIMFSYNTFFVMGFINFNFSIALLLTLTILLLTKYERIKEFKWQIIIGLSSIILYFSHIISLGLFYIFISLLVIINEQKNLISFIKNQRFLFIALIPSLLLLASYFTHSSSGDNHQYISRSVLLSNLFKGNSLNGYGSSEQKWTSIFMLFINLAFIISLYVVIRKQELNHKLKTNLTLFSFLIILLLLYFIMPDTAGQGGIISARIEFIFLIYLLITIVTNIKSMPILSMLLVVLSYYQINKRHSYQKRNILECSKTISEIKYISNLISENSIVLPINYSDNWLFLHTPNIIGFDKKVIIMENYEASSDHFPLIWKEKSEFLEPFKNNFQNARISEYNNAFPDKKIDYLLINNFPKFLKSEMYLNSNINTDYRLLYHSKDSIFSLYQLNR